MNLGEIVDRQREHVDRAEAMLAAALDDDPVTREIVDARAQAMILRAARVHATLALYWQAEARERREAL